MFSIAMFRDGTVEVSFREKDTLKVTKVKPRNPVTMALTILSTLPLAMDSRLISQRIDSLIQEKNA